MKLRWLTIAVGLAAFSAVPWTMAQDQDKNTNQPKAGDVQNAPAQPRPICRRRMTARSSTTAPRPMSMRWEIAMSVAGAAWATGTA